MDTIKIPVSGSRCIYIKAADEETSLDQNLYAINWLNTKIGWMYALYGILAARSLLKAGGRPRFKGKVTKILQGNDTNTRETLLIVKYPSGNAFRSLVEKTFFKIISIFRIRSVDKFTFGFATKDKITPEKPARDLTKAYAVHHFRKGESVFGLLRNPELRDPVQVIFAGMIKAHLYGGDHEKAKVQVPCVMDGLIVYAAENELTLTSFFESEEYRAVIGTTENSFIGLLKREI